MNERRRGRRRRPLSSACKQIERVNIVVTIQMEGRGEEQIVMIQAKCTIGDTARDHVVLGKFLDSPYGLSSYLRATVPRPDLSCLHTREARRRASKSCLT